MPAGRDNKSCSEASAEHDEKNTRTEAVGRSQPEGGARNTLKCARFMHIHVGVLIVYYIITCSILGAMVVCRKLHSQKNVVALIFTADD